MSIEARERKERSDGARSRRAILDAAAKLVTVEGLDGISIGRLAEHIGMSKSGLYAHFGSKEELQLATVDTAGQIFFADVVAPALEASSALDRVKALCERYLDHLERRVFPGGCFFASAAYEFGGQPGPVKERIADFQLGWVQIMVDQIGAAVEAGELSDREDPA